MTNCAKNLLSAKAVSVIGRRTGPVSAEIYSSVRSEFDLSKPLESFVPILRDAERYSKAFGMLKAFGESGSKNNEKAVYILGVEGRGISKIGVSFDPLKRYADIQSSNYRKLYIHAVIFCPTRKSVSIEQAVLRNAESCDKRLNGEWVEMPADETLLLALEVARENKWPVCDGQTWFENIAAKTFAMASVRRISRRY